MTFRDRYDNPIVEVVYPKGGVWMPGGKSYCFSAPENIRLGKILYDPENEKYVKVVQMGSTWPEQRGAHPRKLLHSYQAPKHVRMPIAAPADSPQHRRSSILERLDDALTDFARPGKAALR